MIKAAIVLCRATAILLLLAIGVVLALPYRFAARRAPAPVVRAFHRCLLAAAGVRVHCAGVPAERPVLIVANHISWIDIPLIAMHGSARFLSKAEVSRWPLIAGLAQAAGTLFIDRRRGGAAAALDAIERALNSGQAVVVFPEGTTTDQALPRRIHGRLLAAAVDAQCHLQPVALSYSGGSAGGQLAPFVGDDSLVAHIWRLLWLGPITAQVRFLRPLPPTAAPDELADAARGAICAALRMTSAASRRAVDHRAQQVGVVEVPAADEGDRVPSPGPHLAR